MQWYVETDRPGCLEIHDKFELKRRLHGKLGWLLALENPIRIRRRASKIIGPVNAIGQQTANFSEETEWIYGRETIASRQRCDLYAMGICEAIRHHDKATTWLACLCGNDGFQLGSITNRRCYCLHGQ